MGTGAKCEGCQLGPIGSGFIQTEIGKRYKPGGLMLIGEAPSRAEILESLPLRSTGKGGGLLMEALRESGVDRGDVVISSLIRCRPLNDILKGAWYQYGAINHCVTSYLIEEVQTLKPKVILAMGPLVAKVLTKEIGGKYGSLDFIHGFVQKGAGAAEGSLVIATYSPESIRGGSPELYPLFQRDLRKAYLVSTDRLVENIHYVLDVKKWAEGKYQTLPSLSDGREYLDKISPSLPIMADIETPRSTRNSEDERTNFADRDINLVQFSQKRGTGIALPFRSDYQEITKKVLSLPNSKVGHNWWGFDLSVLAANGVKVNGYQEDTMVMWKCYQPDLPANLQAVVQYCGFPFPWKHLGDSDPELYAAIDVDATCWVYEALKGWLEKENRLGSYEEYFREFWPLLRDMANRGIPVDLIARENLRELIGKFSLEVDQQIKQLIPVEVLGAKHAKGGYKNPPLLKCEECGEKFREDHFCNQMQMDEEGNDVTVIVAVSYADLAEQNGLVQREVILKEEEKCRCTKKTREQCLDCAGTGKIPAGTVEQRWTALVEFNPNSSHQVKRWMRFRKYPIPKHVSRKGVDGEAADTTEMKELERLFKKTKDPVFELLIQKRQMTKMLGTYVEGYEPDRDGKIRSTFGFGPATGQLNSKSPNVQNSPARGKSVFQQTLVDGFNKMLCSSPNHTLINFDYKSFHAQTTGCEAGLPDYLRLAKIDIHSFNACHFIKHPERHGLLKRSDEDLKQFFGELKKDKRIWTNGLTFKQIRDSKTKAAGLGIGFGMGGAKLFKLYPEDFESTKESEAIWNLIMVELFPGLKKWQDRIRRIAGRYHPTMNPEGQGFLLSRFGMIRRFTDTLRWDSNRQKMINGEQGEAAIAFLPASNAFGMIRWGMLNLEKEGLLERFRLINTTHDSLKFDCPDHLVEECLERVPKIMEAPCPMMVYAGITGPEGLSVEVESQVGKSVFDLH